MRNAMHRIIEHNAAQQQFQYEEDAQMARLDYTLSDGVMTITHTGVPRPLEGRGIAGDLTRTALDTARREGWKVRPACSYAHAYINRHPEYQDLLP